MMGFPCLDIDIDKIEDNSRILTSRCAKLGIDVAGVSKVVCGHPKVARAMLRGGVKQIADSRIENIRRMRDDGIRVEFLLLRLPMLSDVAEVVRLVDISLNSELKTIKALSDEALRTGKLHRVILMIDLGDLREGILPKDALETAETILGFKGVQLHGIGTNLACFGGVQPDRRNMELLVHIANELRQQLSIDLPVVSGGNTFSLPLVVQNELPEGINHLRLGASIILNSSPTPTELKLHSDTIRLRAEVLELKEKPSEPYGMVGEDAFGKKPTFENKGGMLRCILGVGREDIDPDGLFPIDHGVSILGASSDHLMVDSTDLSREVNIGDTLSFNLNYSAVLAAMTSNYVYKNILYHSQKSLQPTEVHILEVPVNSEKEDTPSRKAPEHLIRSGLLEQIEHMGMKALNVGKYDTHVSDSHVSKFVASKISQGIVPLVLGGPHSVIIQELTGVGKAISEYGLICFDAHGDIITTLLSEHDDQQSFTFANFVIIGVRDLTRVERQKLQKSSITVFTMEEIDRFGMVDVMQRSLDLALTAVDGLHVSLDLSFVDPSVAPGVVTPKPGGISYREAHLAMELIADTGKLISMDITELAPGNDHASMTIKLGISLLVTLLGKRLLQ